MRRRCPLFHNPAGADATKALPGTELGQTFQPSDLGVVAFLVLLEGLLSADNALVLAMMVRPLKRELRKKALTYGLLGAFVFRFIAIFLAAFLIRLWWLQALGALYLIYLPIREMTRAPQKQGDALREMTFWQTVLMVELADISFAIDSVLAGVAVVQGSMKKVWVVYSGAVIGLVLLRFAANLVSNVMDSYPQLEKVAYLLVLWVGVKLAFLSVHNATEALHTRFMFPEMAEPVFWAVMALIIIAGSLAAFRSASPEAVSSSSEEVTNGEN